MRVLRAADRIAMPWKNGGGLTREVAVWPPGAGVNDFAWRISLADVATDGPFSAFPGVDRVLTVIDGAGLVLEVEGQAERLEPDAPFVFPGEAAVVARLTAGPIRDLNVMVRRGAWTARVGAWRGGGGERAAGPTLVVMLDDTDDLAALDVVLFDAGDMVTLDLHPKIRALAIALRTSSPTIG